MNRREYKQWYDKKLTTYEGIMLRRMRSGISPSLLEISKISSLSYINEANIAGVVYSNISYQLIEAVYREMLSEVMLSHGMELERRLLKNQVIDTKSFNPLQSSNFAEILLNFIRLYAGTRIVSLRATLIGTALKLIAQNLSKGKSIQETTREMHKTFGAKNGFYRWELERIARTEGAMASNRAALLAMESSQLVVDKMWIATLDERVRDGEKNTFDHLAMDGVILSTNQYFEVPHDLEEPNRVLYPGDPSGAAANVINCRCTIAPVPRRDNNGNLIIKPKI